MPLIPNRLSDLVAVTARDAEMLPQLRDRLPRAPGWHEVGAPDGWLVTLRAIGDDAVPERAPFVLEGWPDLHRWQGDAEAGHAAVRKHADERGWAAVPGDVSYAHLVSQGCATLVRAPAARVPIYVHRTDDALFVTTRMDLMLALRPEWPWRIDGMVALSWTGAHGVLPLGRTAIEDVQFVPAGHVLEIDLDGRSAGRLSRYWDPWAGPVRGFDERAHADALREALLSYLDVELDSAGMNFLSLSMGVDSSTLAVLTRRTLGTGYAAVSYLPTNATDRATEDRNIDVLNAVAAPTRHVRRHLGDEPWIDTFAGGPVGGLPLIDPGLIELPELHGELGFRTLYGGEWGDAACGDQITLADWLAEAPISRLLLHQARLPVGEKTILHVLRRRAMRMLPLEAQVPSPRGAPAAARPELREEFDDWAAELMRQARAASRPRLRLWYELQLEFWLLQGWEVTSPLDVRRLTPFYHRRVIELAFEAPPHALIGPHVKKPLRRAFAADVPAQLLCQAKGIWPHEPAPVARSWPRDLPAELAMLVREDWFPRPRGDLSYLDRYTLAALEGYVLRLRALRADVKSG